MGEFQCEQQQTSTQSIQIFAGIRRALMGRIGDCALAVVTVTLNFGKRFRADISA